MLEERKMQNKMKMICTMLVILLISPLASANETNIVEFQPTTSNEYDSFLETGFTFGTWSYSKVIYEKDRGFLSSTVINNENKSLYVDLTVKYPIGIQIEGTDFSASTPGFARAKFVVNPYGEHAISSDILPYSTGDYNIQLTGFTWYEGQKKQPLNTWFYVKVLDEDMNPNNQEPQTQQQQSVETSVETPAETTNINSQEESGEGTNWTDEINLNLLALVALLIIAAIGIVRK